ncbi:MAG: Crp/Fnr family transcriptional regulator [Anaerolineae bacterium]|nr:Crp/Fnr family transcriptional regulator [Anaerolineae bacterium]
MKETDTYYHQLHDAVTQWVDLTDRQWSMLSEIFRVKSVGEQENILLPGDHVHELLFVCSGLLRFYYLSESGTESNKAFIAENTFAGPLAASVLGLPVIYGVQALESSILLVASYTDFVALFNEHPIFDRLGRKLAEWLLIHKELRARHLLQQQAKDRYLGFIEQFPELVDRVPQYHIASYLGITDVSLSRLKRSLREEEAVTLLEIRD